MKIERVIGMTETAVERVAKAICEAMGDDWLREGRKGLMQPYGPVAVAAIMAMREPGGVISERFEITGKDFPAFESQLPRERPERQI